jgi:hypothetical protein
MNQTEEKLQDPNISMFATLAVTHRDCEVMEPKPTQLEGLVPELDLSQHTKKNWPSSKNVSQ